MIKIKKRFQVFQGAGLFSGYFNQIVDIIMMSM